jgi:transcriptional regulator with XRE-family HTH domain
VQAAELVRTVRRRRRLTQAKLAIRAGTTQTAISRLESGAQSPTFETVRRLLLVMGEDLSLNARTLSGTFDAAHLETERSLSPRQRLERAFAWMRLNQAVRAGGQRARE